MKNKLYICEHQFVISNNNICDKCRVEEVSETLGELLKSNGVTVDDDTQKINQQPLSKNPEKVADMMIETLVETNNEIRMENIKLGEHNTQLEHEIDDLRSFTSKCVEDITDLTKTISNSEKENKDLKNKISELEDVISNGKEENKRFKHNKERLLKAINHHESEYKDLEDNYNKLFQLGLTNACDFTALKYEHETIKKDYTKLLHNITTGFNKFNKLENEHKSLLEKYSKTEHDKISAENDFKKLLIDSLSDTRRIDELNMCNTRIKRELKNNNLKVDRLLNMNKELSNELEQSKKLSKTETFISLGVTSLVIFLVIQFTLFLA